jgi:hypothetical protein
MSTKIKGNILHNGKGKGYSELRDALNNDVECGCGLACGCDGNYIRFEHSTLGFVKIELEDLYNYLSNTGGIDTTNPDPVANLAAGVLTANTIPVTWDAYAGEANFAKYVFLVDGAIVGESTTQGVTGYTFTGLTPSTSYDVSVYVEDLVGNRSTTETITASTTA